MVVDEIDERASLLRTVVHRASWDRVPPPWPDEGSLGTPGERHPAHDGGTHERRWSPPGTAVIVGAMITSTFPTVCAESVGDTAAFSPDLFGFERHFVAACAAGSTEA